MRRKVKNTRPKGTRARSHEAPASIRFCLPMMILGLGGTAVLGLEVRGTRWDGTTFAGQWSGSNGQTVELQANATALGEAIDDIANIDLLTELRGPFGPMAFFLHDGGKVLGDFPGGQTESVSARTLLGEVSIGWNELAGIRLAEPSQWKRANELFEEALQSRSPSQDALISRDQADVKVLQGRLETLDDKGGTFLFANEQRKFQNEKLFGIVFAAGASKPQAAQVLVELTDGSSFMGKIESSDQSVARVAAAFGGTLSLPLANIRRMKFHSDRVEYLSDLKPTTQKSDGVLHAPWTMRADRNVLGEMISLGGRNFERGLGVHSRTELAYPLRGEFAQFAATIGIDDSVRPLGGVVMQILGDGRTLFDSGVVTGSDPPRNILVDVTGVQSLTLLVDYGPGLDASDHADWADARLIRPKNPNSKPGPGS